MRIPIWRIIGCLLLLAFCLWVYNRIEFVEETITGPFQGVAARNPLLAAGRLVEHYGATARYIPAYSKPPQSGATLIFTAPRYWFSPKQNEALLNWVKAEGGHLIVSPQHLQHRSKRAGPNETSRDPLLALLGISVKYLPAQGDKKPPSQTRELPDDLDEMPETLLDLLQQIGDSRLKARPVELSDGTRLKVSFDPRLRLEDLEEDSDWQISDPSTNARNRNDDGDYALGRVFGKGRVTVLANLGFIDNAAIGKDDHAALLVHLVSPAKGQDVWFVYGGNTPALWRWFIDHAWAVLIAAALLLITWLWMISRRFGPLLPARSVARRSIVEHVAASARYLWRSRQGESLYRTLCNDFYKQAYLRHPHWSRLSGQELNQQIILFVHEARISQLSGLTEDDIGHLLDTSHPRNESRFAADSHLLNILRNKL
ncbi:MAG: DUF4350 domain-containing protein [Azoarcus sp.]|jgi:hypothetical protein|nr:DUF4350 domain-containing protein [Azoarcus sp.]